MYQDNINTFSLNSAIKPILIDQFLQNWRSEMGKSSKGTNYNIIKDNISLENYFTSLPTNLYLNLVRFRTGNHKLPVETGRWNDTDHQERKCLLCTKDTVGDEFHYTLECPYFSRQRRALIPPQYYTRPNILKYQNLFSTCNVNTLTNLSKFVGIIMKSFI